MSKILKVREECAKIPKFVVVEYVYRDEERDMQITREDIYCLTVSEADGEVCLKVNKDKGREAYELLKMLYAWKEQADKLSSEEINREEYDNWRYHYPEFDTTQRWAKVPSQELSDALVEAFKDHLKDK